MHINNFTFFGMVVVEAFELNKIMKRIFIFLALSLCLNGSAQNYQWAKQIVGACGSSIITDASGNVYVTGFFRNLTDFDPGPNSANLNSAGNEDIFLAKYDPAGKYLWAKSMGGPGYDISNAIAIDASGNLYITGYFRGTSDFDPGSAVNTLTTSGLNNIFIAKYDNNGNYIWAKNLGQTGNGGSDIAVDGAGNVYVSGEFSGNPHDFDPGPNTANLNSMDGLIFFAKYDTNGNYIWAKNLGSYFSYEDARSIAVDNSGNVYLTGFHQGTADHDPGVNTYTLVSAGGADIFFSKYDANGNFIWAKLIGSAQNDEGFGLALDASNNVCITGYFQSTVDFDPGPNTATLTSAGGKDVFFAKYDANGNYLWARSAGGLNNDMGTSIGIDGTDNVYINGYYGNTANFDPGNSTATITSVSTCTETIYFAKYDPNGNYIYAKGIGGHIEYVGNYLSPFIGLSAIDVNASGDVHITNYFSGTSDFDPGKKTANLTLVSTLPFPSPYDYNGFFAKYSKASCVIQTVNNPQKICMGKNYFFNNHTYNTTGVYYDTLSTSTNCDSIIITQLTVDNLPGISVSGSTLVCINETATLTANGANTYTWSNNSNGASITVSPNLSTTYNVQGTDVNGCVGAGSVVLTVDACTGIEGSDAGSNKFIIYPNPVENVVGIKVSRSESLAMRLPVEIITVYGETIYAASYDTEASNTFSIDMSGLAGGIYFLKVGGDTKMIVKK